MKSEEFKFKGYEETDIYYYRWSIAREKQARGIIIILHGMAEHGARYERFANYLNKHNYIVYALDHRGHGKTGLAKKPMGYFGKGGWDQVVEDTHQLLTIIKSEHKNLPIILLGHSMGSVLAKTFISNYGREIDGVILSGTTNGVNFITRKFGLFIAKTISFFTGPKKESPILHFLFFNNYNKRFRQVKLLYAWLSSDTKEVEKYLEDELCGYVCTSSFYADLMTGINKNAKKINIKKVPKDLPMFIFSGTMDPVGNFSKDVIKTYDLYKKIAKLDNVEVKLYEDGRHEMLNEVNKKEVYEDVVAWLDKVF